MLEQFKSHQTHSTLPDMISWVNDSGESVPPFACVQIDSYNESTGLYSIIKPTWDGALHYVNGPTTILAGGIGTSEVWTRPRAAAILPVTTTFTSPDRVGCDVGPIEGQWSMSPAGTGFRLESNVSAVWKIGTVSRISIREIAVRLTADLDAAAVDVAGNGPVLATTYRLDRVADEYVSLGIDLELWNHSETVGFESGTFGLARWVDGRFWFDVPGGSGGGGDYFWFTVVDLVCPGDDPYTFPDGGLIVSATYSSTGEAPVDDIGGIYNVFDYLGILDYSLDAVDSIVGSKGRASRGAPIGSSDFKWILDSIKVNPICS